jgi:hypothetical protein
MYHMGRQGAWEANSEYLLTARFERLFRHADIEASMPGILAISPSFSATPSVCYAILPVATLQPAIQQDMCAVPSGPCARASLPRYSVLPFHLPSSFIPMLLVPCFCSLIHDIMLMKFRSPPLLVSSSAMPQRPTLSPPTHRPAPAQTLPVASLQQAPLTPRAHVS